MADKKTPGKAAEEKLFTVPLRREWLKVPQNKRARRSVRTVRGFLVRHMKVPEHDIRISAKLNDSIWMSGAAKPPAKVRIKATFDAESGLLHAGLPDEVPPVKEDKKKKKESPPKEEDVKKAVEEAAKGTPEEARKAVEKAVEKEKARDSEKEKRPSEETRQQNDKEEQEKK
jgi:ribosomal protein L31E